MNKYVFLFTFTASFIVLSCSNDSSLKKISKFKSEIITGCNLYDFDNATKNLDSLKEIDSDNINLIDSLSKLITSKQELFKSFNGKYRYYMNEYDLEIQLNSDKKAIKLTQSSGSNETEEVNGVYKMQGDSILIVEWEKQIFSYSYHNHKDFGGDKSKKKQDIGNIKLDTRFNSLQMIKLQITPNRPIELKKI